MTLRLTAVFVAAMFLLGLTACTKAPPPGPRIDPAISGFIPADTQLLAGIRLEKIRKTPVYQKFIGQGQMSFLDGFITETGIDPGKLWELLIISNGTRFAVIGHGMFSDEGEPDLEKRGATRFRYKRFTMVGGDVSSVLLVDQTVFAAGDTDQLKAMVDAHEKSAAPPASIRPLLARMPETAQVWVASTGGNLGVPLGLTGNLGNINKMLGLMQSSTIYLDLTDGVKGLAEGTAKSDQDAEQAASGLRALIGFGRLASPPNQPDLQRAFDGLRPTVEGREIKLHIDEPEDAVEKLLALAGVQKALAK